MILSNNLVEASKKSPIVVMFTMATCFPCKMIKPIIISSVNQRENLELHFANYETDKKMFLDNKIKGVPTIILYHNGKLLSSYKGGPSAPMFNQWLDQFIQKKEAEKSAS